MGVMDRLGRGDASAAYGTVGFRQCFSTVSVPSSDSMGEES
jgi:hypothetical protein